MNSHGWIVGFIGEIIEIAHDNGFPDTERGLAELLPRIEAEVGTSPIDEESDQGDDRDLNSRDHSSGKDVPGPNRTGVHDDQVVFLGAGFQRLNDANRQKKRNFDV